jgi:hypothetical protein
LPSADLNLRLLRHLVRYLTDRHSARELEAIAAAAGMPVADLVNGNGWVSLEQFETLLARARDLMPDDATFMEACAYRLDVVSGPINFMLSAVSPVAAYQAAGKHMHLISQISVFEPEVVSRNRVRIGYRTTREESRLMCLSRQAQIKRLPTLWRLPPAHVIETACVARGDSRCAYDVRLYESRRWAPLAVGTGAAVAVGVALEVLLSAPVEWWWFGLAGAALGHFYELRRTSTTNRQTQEEINAAYLDMAREETSARRELFTMAQREKTWGQLVEHEVFSRKDALLRLTDELGELGRRRDSSQPTARIRIQLNKLRESGLARQEESRSALTVIDAGLDELDRRLARAARLATHAAGSDDDDGLLLPPGAPNAEVGSAIVERGGTTGFLATK